MCIIFVHRSTMLSLRKEFEKRIWKGNDTFSRYFHEKTVLGNHVSISLHEMRKYMLEGIPDVQLLRQTYTSHLRDDMIYLRRSKTSRYSRVSTSEINIRVYVHQ